MKDRGINACTPSRRRRKTPVKYDKRRYKRRTCAIVLDEGMLFRTNESSFVETKRKLVDECDLWAIVSLPGGVFSTAGAGVKTNLLFSTKGKKTERIWYYDLSHVKAGKKSPLTLAHFGFDRQLRLTLLSSTSRR